MTYSPPNKTNTSSVRSVRLKPSFKRNLFAQSTTIKQQTAMNRLPYTLTMYTLVAIVAPIFFNFALMHPASNKNQHEASNIYTVPRTNQQSSNNDNQNPVSHRFTSKPPNPISFNHDNEDADDDGEPKFNKPLQYSIPSSNNQNQRPTIKPPSTYIPVSYTSSQFVDSDQTVNDGSGVGPSRDTSISHEITDDTEAGNDDSEEDDEKGSSDEEDSSGRNKPTVQFSNPTNKNNSSGSFGSLEVPFGYVQTNHGKLNKPIEQQKQSNQHNQSSQPSFIEHKDRHNTFNNNNSSFSGHFNEFDHNFSKTTLSLPNTPSILSETTSNKVVSTQPNVNHNNTSRIDDDDPDEDAEDIEDQDVISFEDNISGTTKKPNIHKTSKPVAPVTSLYSTVSYVVAKIPNSTTITSQSYEPTTPIPYVNTTILKQPVNFVNTSTTPQSIIFNISTSNIGQTTTSSVMNTTSSSVAKNSSKHFELDEDEGDDEDDEEDDEDEDVTKVGGQLLVISNSTTTQIPKAPNTKEVLKTTSLTPLTSTNSTPPKSTTHTYDQNFNLYQTSTAYPVITTTTMQHRYELISSFAPTKIKPLETTTAPSILHNEQTNWTTIATTTTTISPIIHAKSPSNTVFELMKKNFTDKLHKSNTEDPFLFKNPQDFNKNSYLDRNSNDIIHIEKKTKVVQLEEDRHDLTRDILDGTVSMFETFSKAFQSASDAIKPTLDSTQAWLEPKLAQPLIFMFAIGAGIIALVLMMMLFVYLVTFQFQADDDLSDYYA